VNFFKANFEYKKAEVFARRFESLKTKALERINMKVLSIIRDANRESNIRIVRSEIFEKA
jgi:plasmid maintenance system killer protein